MNSSKIGVIHRSIVARTVEDTWWLLLVFSLFNNASILLFRWHEFIADVWKHIF